MKVFSLVRSTQSGYMFSRRCFRRNFILGQSVCQIRIDCVVASGLMVFAGFTASLGQAGAAAFPFMTGAIASKAGVQVLQPIMVALLIGIGFLWALVPRKRPITLD